MFLYFLYLGPDLAIHIKNKDEKLFMFGSVNSPQVTLAKDKAATKDSSGWGT